MYTNNLLNMKFQSSIENQNTPHEPNLVKYGKKADEIGYRPNSPNAGETGE